MGNRADVVDNFLSECTVGARGIAVDFSGASPIVYATTGEGSLAANRLISIVDTGSGSAVTVLATSATGTILRGLEFAPVVPEPSSSLLLLLGLAALIHARKA